MLHMSHWWAALTAKAGSHPGWHLPALARTAVACRPKHPPDEHATLPAGGRSIGHSPSLLPRDFTTPSPRTAPMHPEQAAAARWWRSTSLLAMYVVNAAGFVALPAAWFALGVSKLDLLHGSYLAWMLLYFMRSCLRLAPPPPPPPSLISPAAHAARVTSHTIVRLAGSLHLIAIYLALCLQLPGLHSDFNEAVLRLLGLLDPSVSGDLVPVLLVLLAATVHVATGKWIRDAQEAAAAYSPYDPLSPRSQQPGSVAPTAQLGTKAGKLAIAAGIPLILLLGYLLVLYDTSVSLLGLGYLTLLVLLLLAPPTKASYLQLQHFLEHSYRRRLVRQCGKLLRSWRWLPVVLLALYCCADLALQYLLATGLQPGEELLPPELAAFFKEVVGFDGDKGGGLVVRLLRPALLLLAIYVYRKLFVVGVEGRLTGPARTRSPSTTEGRQGRWSWLLRRLLILHANKLLALSTFFCAMHLPSAGGLALVLALALVCLALRRCPTRVGQGEPWLLQLSQAALEVAVALWLVAVYAFQVGVAGTVVCSQVPPVAGPCCACCCANLSTLGRAG
jgi:hypothetical protein